MKSRHINILEYLDRLQIEYYQADFKRALHHSPKNKAFWRKVMAWKKEKILDVCSKSGIDNIFNNEDEAAEYRLKVFPDAKSIAIKFELKPDELKLYYSVGAPVKVEVEEGKFSTGKIEEVLFDSNLAVIRLRGRKEVSKHLFSKFFRVF